MNTSSVDRLSVAALVAGLFISAGSALADGGAYRASTPVAERVIAQATYRCQGGVQVQVTQMKDSARVEVAGRTRTLKLSGATYRNAEVTWFTQGQTSAMRNNRSGQLQLSGCRTQ